MIPLFNKEPLEVLLSQVGAEEIASILVMIETTVAPKVSEMEKQLAEGNLSALWFTAHALAGACYVFGMQAIATEAKSLERDAKMGATTSIIAFSLNRLKSLVGPSINEVYTWCEANGINLRRE